MPEQKINTDRGIKIMITITGVSVVAYFSGPLSAIIARGAFTTLYGYLYGIPNTLSFENFTVYSPMKEHVSRLAYDYGAGTLAVLSAPIFYKSLDLCKWIVGYNKKDKIEGDLQALEERLDELEKCLIENKMMLRPLTEDHVKTIIFKNKSKAEDCSPSVSICHSPSLSNELHPAL